MVPKGCKRLAEVDFPIAIVSNHSVKENKVRHGHPKALHLWWARRPLAACRAILMALLLPDPCDPKCPEGFKKHVRAILPSVQGDVGATDVEIRNELLRFIGEFARWENSVRPKFLDAARGLIRAVYGEETPLVVDPFSGGGSIPLEALRLGCDAFASDLNPVASLILKTLLEDIPRHGHDLADDLKAAGAEVKAAVEKELSEFYPLDADGSKPISYLWARTITCDSCGAEISLIRSFWLSTKSNRKRALNFTVVRKDGELPHVEFRVFEPKTDDDVPKGTVTRVKARCLCCNQVSSPDRVRTQLAAQNGGANPVFDESGNRTGGARLLAVATLNTETSGRKYRIASARDYQPVYEAMKRVALLDSHRSATVISALPDEDIPRTELRRIALPIYGIVRFRDMFTCRQLVGLSTLATSIRSHKAARQSESINRFLALALDKTADLNNAHACWKPDAECPVHTVARHDLPMSWDFVEAVPTCESSGSFMSAYQRTADSIEPSDCHSSGSATVQRADACAHPLPCESADIWFTDPPYYDSVPYAHLSDFFLVWARRALANGEELPSLAPKNEECVVDRAHSLVPNAKTAAQFEARIGAAMKRGAEVVRKDGAGAIVFAHKTTEGWEALLSGVIAGGWVITASWPIATEMRTRLNARENASLGTSVHLIVRPRTDSVVGDWNDVYRELPIRTGEWMERLEREGVRGADLVFACIGPAMEVYSRYSRVEDAEGREIPLGGDPTATEPYKRGFLAYVWETVGRLALEQVLGTAEAKARNGAAGALEEDSRLTALFLWTLQTTEMASNDADADGDDDTDDEDSDDEKPGKKKAGFTLIYDVARRFAQPLGIHLDKWEGRIIETEKGVVRLLPIAERAKHLFGDADASAMAHRIEQDVKASRNYTFAFMQDVAAPPEIKARGRGKRKATTSTGAAEVASPQTITTLDRVHAAMLLQASGQANGLRAMLKEEQQRGPDFLRLANALSALYPKDSEEKRLLDAMLLAVPRN
jgi:putative DNA methylase